MIERPGGEVVVKAVTVPPKEQNGAILESPQTVNGPWYLDQQGTFWLHQSFDRVYKLAAGGKWEMLKNLGTPQWEHPAHQIWFHRTERVFDGYETADTTGERRSRRPTYLQHLTPFSAKDDVVTCLSPVGLASLRTSKEPSEEEIISAPSVSFGGEPLTYLGASQGRLWFVVRTLDTQTQEFRAQLVFVRQ
jgi:hypothetical protein